MNKTINGLKKLISARRAHIVSSQPKSAFDKMPDLSIEKEAAVPPMPEVQVSTVQTEAVEVPAELRVAAEAPVEAAVAEEAPVAEAPAEEEVPVEKASRKSKKKKKA